MSEKSREESDLRNGSEEIYTMWCAGFDSPEQRAQDKNLDAGRLFLGGDPRKLDRWMRRKSGKE